MPKEFTGWFRSYFVGQGYVSQGHQVCVKGNFALPQRELDAAEECVNSPFDFPFKLGP
jgi:hypothetical protein